MDETNQQVPDVMPSKFLESCFPQHPSSQVIYSVDPNSSRSEVFSLCSKEPTVKVSSLKPHGSYQCTIESSTAQQIHDILTKSGPNLFGTSEEPLVGVLKRHDNNAVHNSSDNPASVQKSSGAVAGLVDFSVDCDQNLRLNQNMSKSTTMAPTVSQVHELSQSAIHKVPLLNTLKVLGEKNDGSTSTKENIGMGSALSMLDAHSHLPLTASDYSEATVHSAVDFGACQNQVGSRLYAFAKMVDTKFNVTNQDTPVDKEMKESGNAIVAGSRQTLAHMTNASDKANKSCMDMTVPFEDLQDGIRKTDSPFMQCAKKIAYFKAHLPNGDNFISLVPNEFETGTLLKANNTELDASKIVRSENVCHCRDKLNDTDSRMDTQVHCKDFFCGGCGDSFASICCLHAHLHKHGSRGSYHYDHISRTAFPKFDTTCSYSQTESDDYVIDDGKCTQATDRQAVGYKDTCLDMVAETNNIYPCEPTVLKWSVSKVDNGSRKPLVKLNSDNGDKKSGRYNNLQTESERLEDAVESPEVEAPTMISDSLKNEFNKNDIGEKATKVTDMSYTNETFAGGLDDDEKEYAVGDNVTKEKLLITNARKPRRKRQPNHKTDHYHLDNDLCRNKKKMTLKKKCVPIDIESDKGVKSLVEHAVGGSKHSDNYKETPLLCIPKHKMETGSEDSNTVSGPVENLKKDTINLTGKTKYSSCNIENTVTAKSTSKVKKKKEKEDKSAGNKDKYQVCSECGLMVPRYKFVFHMRQHTGERPYVCEKCGKSFARSRFLTKHLITHKEEKPWKCQLCPSQFCQKSEYKMHMAGHEDDRPHKCNVCDMRFLSKTSLHTHQANIHMGLTRFECDICRRRFYKRSSLNVHMATHFEPTLKCNYCDRKFRDKTGRKRHERIHTGVKSFQCHICDHAFIQSTPYWGHMERHHSMSKGKIKEMLKTIKERNRRAGIKAETNTLPPTVYMSGCSEQTSSRKLEVTPGTRETSEIPSDASSNVAVDITAADMFLSNQHGTVTHNDDVALIARHYGIPVALQVEPSGSQSVSSQPLTIPELDHNMVHQVVSLAGQSLNLLPLANGAGQNLLPIGPGLISAPASSAHCEVAGISSMQQTVTSHSVTSSSSCMSMLDRKHL